MGQSEETAEVDDRKIHFDSCRDPKTNINDISKRAWVMLSMSIIEQKVWRLRPKIKTTH